MVLLLYSGYLCFQSDLKIIKVYSKVIGVKRSNIMFQVHIDVQMVVLIYKE